MRSVHVVISGTVQGVGYRAWTEDAARGLGLAGWVRNRRDGSVEAHFSGNDDAVARMLRLCEDGPPHASVTGVQVTDAEPASGGFEVRETA